MARGWDDDYADLDAPPPASGVINRQQWHEREGTRKFGDVGTMSVSSVQGVSRKKDPTKSPRTRTPLEQQAHTMSRQRERWEQGPGAERMRGIENHPDLGPHYQGMKVGQIYHAMGWAETQDKIGPKIGEQQLPGLEDPHAAPQPERWEDMPETKRKGIEQRVQARTGATVESMTRAIGTQTDQAFLRMHRHGADKPHAADFYTSGEPSKVIQRTAEEHGVPAGLVAAMHADNSPNTPFESMGRYPQDEMTRAALKHVQSGDAEPHEARRPKGAQGMTGNYLKSTQRAHQVLNEGRSLGDTRPSVGGYGEAKGTGLGPKTAPYLNSWLPSTPDFFVADVHSGGGGALPHLSSAKPLKQDPEGYVVRKPDFREDPRHDAELPHGAFVREKAQREEALGAAGIHSMIDYAARQAFTARGLGRLRQGQAAQWGEERIQRGFSKEHEAYPPKTFAETVHPDQGKLF